MLTLSKSKYVLGLQCPKLLWCLFNAPELIPPIDESTQAIFDQGHEVGNFAKKLHPSGVEVNHKQSFEQKIKQTSNLIKQKKTIFEASLNYKNAYCQADILVPNQNEWDLIEVKSSSKLKDEYLEDVAFQKYCIEGSGLKIRHCHLMHVNNEYAKAGEIEPNKLFIKEDITEQVTKITPLVEERINKMLKIINNPKMPNPNLGTECLDPAKCPVCMNNLPKNNVTELYRMGKQAYPLINNKIILINDLPKNFKLNGKQKIQQGTLISGKPQVNVQEIKKFLKSIKYPLYFLDFETINPAIPLFDGTRPFQNIPFQSSLHIIKKRNAKPEHVEFLANNAEDPRKNLTIALKNIKSKGTVLAYNMSFEKNVIEDLQKAFPKEKWLHSIISRMNDLILPFKNFWYYHPAQHGSCSIKAVLPALTSQSYAHLEVSKGDEAARKFLQMTYREKKTDNKLRKALLEYCKQDTQGMIDILKHLETAISK